MSTATKRPLAQVEPLARGLTVRLEPYCQRIEVAGSIRRQCPLVGDIEIVAIAKTIDQGNLLGDLVQVENLLHTYLDELLEKEAIRHGKYKRWGAKMRTFEFTVPSGDVKVDLFMCLPDTWGSTLLIRTGSDDFSRWMVTQVGKGGALPDGYRHKSNYVFDEQMEPVPMPEEGTFFELCDIPIVPPIFRQDGLWHEWIAEEMGFV